MAGTEVGRGTGTGFGIGPGPGFGAGPEQWIGPAPGDGLPECGKHGAVAARLGMMGTSDGN